MFTPPYLNSIYNCCHKMSENPKIVAASENTALYNMLLIESLIEALRERKSADSDEVEKHAKQDS